MKKRIMYFIFYHGHKYFFEEVEFKECKFYGVRKRHKGMYYCIINSRYSKERIVKVRHALLTGRKLKYSKKRKQRG